jgi:putative transposase
VTGFVDWYNTQHLHSAIKLVTPQLRHCGDDTEILANRKRVYQQAKAKDPIRWSGEIRNWDSITEVHLNPEKKENEAA